MSANDPPPAHRVNFGCGHPQASMLPTEQVAAATNRVLQGPRGSEFLQYGSEIGQPYAREQLASFLSREYSWDVSPDTLSLATGVTHGIQLTVQALKRDYYKQQQKQSANSKSVEPPLCWVEDPTYFLVPFVLQQADYELGIVPTTAAHGLDISALEPMFQQARKDSPNRLLFLYCIPTHHNPLGVSLSEEERVELVRVCEQYQIYLIADEVYHGLSFPETPSIQPMAMRSPYVISVSATTKTLCPGTRCGWIHASPEIINKVQTDAVNISQGCACQLSSGIVAEMIASNTLLPHLTSLRLEYSKRCHHLCDLLLKQPLAESSNVFFRLQVPQGGYFVWVELEGIEFDLDEDFRKWCVKEYDVDFKTGAVCSSASWQKEEEVTVKKYPKCMRLCFAYYDIPKLTEGVERLCRAIEAYPKRQVASSSL